MYDEKNYRRFNIFLSGIVSYLNFSNYSLIFKILRQNWNKYGHRPREHL